MTHDQEETEKQLTFEFEPDLDLQEDEWLDIEDQMVEVAAEKFGDKYKVYEYHLEMKMIVSVKKKESDNNNE